MTSDKNVMKDFDSGAIVKMIGGGKELRLKKSKVRLPVPPPDCWIPNFKGGGASLEFIQVGSQDYHPLSRRFIGKEGAKKEDILKAIKELFKKEYPERDYAEAFWQEIDVQSKLKDVNIVPIPADLKSHMAMEAEENIIKHHRANKMKEYIPLIIIVLCLAFLTFAVIWYFKYADILSTKTITSGKDYIQQCSQLITKACGASVSVPIDIPIEGAELPPI